MKHSKILKHLLAITLVAGVGAACSFATNTTAVQCASEAECLGRGPDFAGTTCDKVSRTCVKLSSEVGLCKTNAECIKAAGGAEAICRKSTRKCVTLKTPECPRVFAAPGQLLNDDAIVVGMISAAGKDPSSGSGDQMEKAARLAQDEITSTTRGLPAVDGSAGPRPIVLVGCDEFQAGYEGILREANHLAKDIGVPVVLGPVDSSNAAFAQAQVFNPAGVLSILPDSVSSVTLGIANPIAPTPISWTLSYLDRHLNQAYSELVTNQLEPKLRASGVTGNIRIAVLVEQNPLGQGSANDLETRLRFNSNRTALENGNPTDGSAPSYLRISIGDFLDPVGNPNPAGKVAAAIAAMVKFNPHIVFHSYAPSATPATFVPAIQQWPQGIPYPYHIDLLGAFPLVTPVYDMVNAANLKGKMFSATSRIYNQERTNAWLIKFRGAYPELVSATFYEAQIVQAFYDAFYMAAYAMAGVGKKPLTGANAAAALPLLVPPGQLIRAGSEDLAKGFAALGSGAGIDYDGLTAALDLSLTAGTGEPDIDVTCPEISPQTGKTIGRFKRSGFFTTATKGQGALNCN